MWTPHLKKWGSIDPLDGDLVAPRPLCTYISAMQKGATSTSPTISNVPHALSVLMLPLATVVLHHRTNTQENKQTPSPSRQYKKVNSYKLKINVCCNILSIFHGKVDVQIISVEVNLSGSLSSTYGLSY